MAIKLRSLVLATLAAACLPASALAENVKIAFIDPLSGPFAPVGQGILYIVFCWTFIPALIGFIEGIVYLCMTDKLYWITICIPPVANRKHYD